MIKMLVRVFKAFQKRIATNRIAKVKRAWYEKGQIPWQEGYIHVKEELVKNYINDNSIINSIKQNRLPKSYGYRIDERIVEYPWILSKLSNGNCRLLDAGSTFNFSHIIAHPKIISKQLSIYTYYPESYCFYEKRISYQFGDLRALPYKDNYFNEIVCQSTLEHIDMDNSLYGYDLAKTSLEKSYDYLIVIAELERVLNINGLLLLTFPYGRFENHGFFQQFDKEMLDRIELYLSEKGSILKDFFKYEEQGWSFAQQAECESMESYNPHTGKGKKMDNAAHSRAICCLQFIKK